MTIKELLKDLISKKSNTAVNTIELSSIGGGSINDTYRVTINGKQKLFLKLNSLTSFPGLFEKERNGLAFIAGQNCIRVPGLFLYETTGTHQLLLLDWIEGGIRTNGFWKKFGEQLASVHRVSHDQFGFVEDNYMGSLPQLNKFTPKWVDFFIHQRLRPQMELASHGHHFDKNHISAFETVFKKLDSIFSTEPPSLLHGDLWSGNFMCDENSSPVLIDPAVYFGHRSIDLAMTTLFGGFDQSFYEAYHYHFPLPSNYDDQWEICNLYPLLIHLNLFGKSYLGSIEATLKRFA